MTDSTENATSPKSTKFSNSNLLIPVQIKPKSQFEFAPRPTEKSEFLDSVDFGGVASSVQSVISTHTWCMCHVDYIKKCVVRASERYTLSDMRWLRVVGSLKLWVSCAECRLFCRALLQKRPII